MNTMRLRPTSFLLAAALAWCAPAVAQQAPPPETPAEQPAMPSDDLPAVDAAPGASKAPKVGTDIVGERESPIGLFITPWKDSGAEGALDHPARLLQEELTLIDENVFIRNLEYHEALTGALKAKKVVAPLLPSSTPAAPSAGTPGASPAPKP